MLRELWDPFIWPVWNWIRTHLQFLGWRSLQHDDEDLDRIDESLLLFDMSQDDAKNLQITWKTGQVSRVEQDHFIVDQRYFWPADLALQDLKLRQKAMAKQIEVGMDVRCKLQRRGEHEEWQIIDVHEVNEGMYI